MRNEQDRVTMYYEEKIINGVLCSRHSPNGEWEPFTIESLSTAFVAVMGQLGHERDKNKRLQEKLDRIEKAVSQP